MSSYVLKIDSSPQGDNSISRTIGNAFSTAFSAAYPNVEIRTRDLAANPLNHIDGEALTAGYVPEDKRSPGMRTKHQLRLDLIQELVDAKAIVVTAPMWNWAIPSGLKAWVDHIVMPGVLDPYGNRKLAGKKVTIILAAGSAYGPDSHHPEWDYESNYLRHIFTSLGAEDIEVIRAEYTLAGVVPGMESLVDAKQKSLANANSIAEARAKLALN